MMTTQTEITQKNHHRAVRYFWVFLLGATTVSLTGNVVHAILPYVPPVVIQIGAAAVPPISLLAAVHGIALAVRAGASGTVYRSAVGAVAAIGVGAFALSFLALRDLMLAIGYSAATAWVFPAIVDTTVGVSTLMLVALGDKPARRNRTASTSASAEVGPMQRLAQTPIPSAKAQLKRYVQATRSRESASAQLRTSPASHASAQTIATQSDADLASELIAARVTNKPVETVVAVLAARRDGASINAAAKTSSINYRTAQRIVQAADQHRQRQLAVAS
jgi:Protein of unknown function (DUF2637)